MNYVTILLIVYHEQCPTLTNGTFLFRIGVLVSITIEFRRISELESTEIQAKQEIGRLREVSEVATYQVGAINDMKVLDEKEFQSLRLQLLDLQSKSDDKSEIGRS